MKQGAKIEIGTSDLPVHSWVHYQLSYGASHVDCIFSLLFSICTCGRQDLFLAPNLIKNEKEIFSPI